MIRTTQLLIHIRRAATALALSLSLAAFAGGCYEFQPAPGTPGLSQAVDAVESVLKERYYQTRVYRSVGHAVALSPIEVEGAYPVMWRIDVRVTPERTGHYMPRVYARKYIDLAEPPLEGPDGFTSENVEGNPFPSSRWSPLYYDRTLEAEIRNAILEKLNIPAVALARRSG